MTSEQDKKLEIAMGHMLRIGVSTAALVALAGGVLYLRQFRDSVPEYQDFHGAPPSANSISAITKGAGHLDGPSLISLGILILIATPVCRVIFGVFGFALERDRTYTAISMIVLIVLLASFFVRR